ncbi:MAG: DUF3800 domain-containing protein [Erythrobacter sp.]|jgi:hypothetical protein
MPDLLLYLDDSGTRNPDRGCKAIADPDRPDWFALGGILLASEDESAARQLHSDFCRRWDITYPLHSSDIRFRKGEFNWLKHLSIPEFERFHEDLAATLIAMPVRGIACVIDRPGYNNRYLEKYGRQRWSLCKTAFSVVVERAAKAAISEGRRLRVFPERADKQADGWLAGYFRDLREAGMPFAVATSEKYAPLTNGDLGHTLREFRPKYKSSPMVQIADLYLYPICRGGYVDYRPLSILREEGKLIDCTLSDDELPSRGIKYSCFELVREGR